MSLSEFIEKLKKLESQGYGDYTMYATHGASGVSDPIGNPYIREVTGNEIGELSDLIVGTPYVNVYIGN
jgi:hypothetical protein